MFSRTHVELKCCKRTCAYHALRARVCQVSPGAWVGLLQGGILAACAKAGMRHNQGRQASDAASAGMLQPCGFTLRSSESSWSVLPLSGSTRYRPCILKQREMVCPPSSTEASEAQRWRLPQQIVLCVAMRSCQPQVEHSQADSDRRHSKGRQASDAASAGMLQPCGFIGVLVVHVARLPVNFTGNLEPTLQGSAMRPRSSAITPATNSLKLC